MNFYFAPMEGLTGHVYRNAHHVFFNNIDKYFAPFIVAHSSDKFRSRERNDLIKENNPDIVLVPQILTNNAGDFIHTADKIKDLGYDEINLNLGCPSGTVVSKNKGSGFLALPEELDRFLDEIFSRAVTKISIKTRLGKDQPEEFYALMNIFNKYPVSELIIHPRIQKDHYKNKPRLQIFADALSNSKNPVCYNGDLFTTEDFRQFSSDFPAVDTVMLGRGLVTNPGLIDVIKNSNTLDKYALKGFHDMIYEGYQRILSGDRNVLFKMKELWSYMILLFTDSASNAKRIRKAACRADYDSAVSRLFRDQDFMPTMVTK